MTGPHRFLTALAATGVMALACGGVGQAQPQGGAPSGAQQQQNLPNLLHLRPDQMGSFHAYQMATQPNPDEISRLRGASPQVLAGLPTPQRLDRIGAFIGAQQQMFRRSADATRTFYRQLSPDQQQTFDRLSAPSQGRGRGQPQPQ